ncbi:uncharacterized protein PAC_09056 [Phialocephala subalpina]|uniref:Uncharacterized protein n=1 Tax=Phialocephala subalpina TaxID=576137 RepID=A0A1L7X2C0_9HELO|nr:uncharacterized protein PAC_09056 [Phialocephala subalpina]
MPAQEVQQPQAQQMEVPSQTAASVNAEQPRAVEQMTAEPATMRGGDGGEVCCGIDAAAPVLPASSASNAAAKCAA